MLSLLEINKQKYKFFVENNTACFMCIPQQLKQKISIVFDNIENFSCECIVNAANEGLLGGGGIDGTIHNIAGQKLNEFIQSNISADEYGARIYEGNSIITPGFDSNYKKIIHTVAPYYDDNNNMKPNIMKRCFDSIFTIVRTECIEEICITPIGTGFYGFHMLDFTLICFRKIIDELCSNDNIKKVYLITNDELQFMYYDFFMKHYLLEH
jgi:O-acetyl-ADP-ribose deacetylase (regulator of RNase III)